MLNAGVGGYSTDQELLWLRQRGRQFKPDVVVLAFYRNDILSNASGSYFRGPKPRFGVRAGHLVEPPIPPGPKPRPLTITGWHQWSHKLATVSHVYHGSRQLVWRLKWRAKRFIEARQFTGRDTLETLPEPASVTAGWNLTSLLLRQMAIEVRATGARFMVLWVPAADLVQAKDDGSYDQNVVGRRLAETTARLGIELIDPLAELRAAATKLAPRAERAYFARDGHWTPHGTAVIGEVLASRLGYATVSVGGSN